MVDVLSFAFLGMEVSLLCFSVEVELPMGLSELVFLGWALYRYVGR